MRNGLPQLAQALDIAQFIPDAYTAYRPLIAEGVIFFLEHLPPLRAATSQVDIPRQTNGSLG